MKTKPIFIFLLLSLFWNLIITSTSFDSLSNQKESDQNNDDEGIFPLKGKQISGAILIALITGLANTGGMGGGPLLTSILIMFFDYTINQALVVVYSLIFGGSLGNFLNVVGRRDFKTKKPLVNYDLALICMPTMVLGTNIGVIFGRTAAPIVLLLGIIILPCINVTRIFKRAKKQYAEESQEKHGTHVSFVNSDGELNHGRELTELADAGEQGVIDPELNDLLQKEHKLFPKTKYAILIGLLLAVMLLSLLRGSHKFHSIIGLSYCGVGYWGIYILTLAVCLLVFFLNQSLVRKNIQIKEHSHLEAAHGGFELDSANTRKLTLLSGFAGLLAGLLGVGGGMIMNPTLLKMGIPAQNVAATLGFFVVQTSFISMFQSLLYGDVPLKEEGFFFLIAVVGSLSVSFFLTWLVKKTKRASIVLFTLVAILILTILVTPAFEIWQNFDNLKKLIEFKSIC